MSSIFIFLFSISSLASLSFVSRSLSDITLATPESGLVLVLTISLLVQASSSFLTSRLKKPGDLPTYLRDSSSRLIASQSYPNASIIKPYEDG